MLDNIFFNWTINHRADQLLGIARTNNMMIIDDEGLEGENIEMKECLSIGILIIRIDIVF